MQINHKSDVAVAPPQRGDVYLVNLDQAGGKESAPALIIQNDVGNRFSPITIVAPITWAKELSRPLPITIFLEKGEAGLNEDSYIDCGQIHTIDKEKKLLAKCGSVDKPKLLQVDKALRISLDLQ